MKIVHPELTAPLEWNIYHPAHLVVEDPKIYLRFLCELSAQSQGDEGCFVLSEKNETVSLDKDAVLIRDPLSIDLNQRKIMSAVTAKLRGIAKEELFIETQILQTQIQEYTQRLFDMITQPLYCDEQIEFSAILKASGMHMENAEHPIERILDYVQAAQEFLHIKLVILTGIRSLFTDEIYMQFCKEIAARKLHILFLESSFKKRIFEERVLIVDSDHCELLFR